MVYTLLGSTTETAEEPVGILNLFIYPQGWVLKAFYSEPFLIRKHCCRVLYRNMKILNLFIRPHGWVLKGFFNGSLDY